MRPTLLPEISRRREILGWYCYDWANSAFATTVVTVFLGPYLTSITKAAADLEGFVHPFGFAIKAGSFFPYLVSLSVLLQVFTLPLLGAIADFTQSKKRLLGLFAYIGAFATMGLYFLEGQRYLFGGLLFLIANLSFGASIVFYNAFLPEIAATEDRNKVSSRGWATGYLGGGLLLAMNLFLFSKAEQFGLSTTDAVRICLGSAGLWWAIFTLIPLATLRNRQHRKVRPKGEHYLSTGFKQLRRTLSDVRKYPQTFLFLAAYLIYNDGIQTVIALSSQFGQEALGLSISTLTTVILMVQFVAFFGSLLFERIAYAITTKKAILLSLVIWSGTLIYAYAWLKTEAQFFVMAAVIGMVLGGSQALSRALFSLMIPKGQEAEYFSLYEISERGTSWIGPLLFGLALQFTGNYRIALLSLLVFFIAGLLLLLKVDVKKALAAVGNQAD